MAETLRHLERRSQRIGSIIEQRRTLFDQVGTGQVRLDPSADTEVFLSTAHRIGVTRTLVTESIGRLETRQASLNQEVHDRKLADIRQFVEAGVLPPSVLEQFQQTAPVGTPRLAGRPTPPPRPAAESTPVAQPTAPATREPRTRSEKPRVEREQPESKQLRLTPRRLILLDSLTERSIRVKRTEDGKGFIVRLPDRTDLEVPVDRYAAIIQAMADDEISIGQLTSLLRGAITSSTREATRRDVAKAQEYLEGTKWEGVNLNEGKRGAGGVFRLQRRKPQLPSDQPTATPVAGKGGSQPIASSETAKRGYIRQAIVAEGNTWDKKPYTLPTGETIELTNLRVTILGHLEAGIISISDLSDRVFGDHSAKHRNMVSKYVADINTQVEPYNLHAYNLTSRSELNSGKPAEFGLFYWTENPEEVVQKTVMEESDEASMITNYEAAVIAVVLSRKEVVREFEIRGIPLYRHVWLVQAQQAVAERDQTSRLTNEEMDRLRGNIINKLSVIIAGGTYDDVARRSGLSAENLLAYCALELDRRLPEAFQIVSGQLKSDRERPRGRNGLPITMSGGQVYHIGDAPPTPVGIDRWEKTRVPQQAPPRATHRALEASATQPDEPGPAAENDLPVDTTGSISRLVPIDELPEGAIVVGSLTYAPEADVSLEDLPRPEVEALEGRLLTPQASSPERPKTRQEMLAEQYPRLRRRNDAFAVDMERIVDSALEQIPEFRGDINQAVTAVKMLQLDPTLNEVWVDRFLGKKTIKPRSKDGNKLVFSIVEIAVMAYVRSQDPRLIYDVKTLKEVNRLAREFVERKRGQIVRRAQRIH